MTTNAEVCFRSHRNETSDMSTVFSAALLSLNHIASAVIGIAQRIGQNEEFELSNDSESVFCGGLRYEYIGYCDGGVFPSFIYEDAEPGKRLGHICNDKSIRVWQLDTPKDDFILVGASCDCADIYRLAR